MGKRELLLIAVFVVVGTGVYQMTAPARPGVSGFSLSRLLEHVRSEIARAGRRATGGALGDGGGRAGRHRNPD